MLERYHVKKHKLESFLDTQKQWKLYSQLKYRWFHTFINSDYMKINFNVPKKKKKEVCVSYITFRVIKWMFWQLTNSVYEIEWYKEHRQNKDGCMHLFGGATEDELWVETI